MSNPKNKFEYAKGEYDLTIPLEYQLIYSRKKNKFEDLDSFFHSLSNEELILWTLEHPKVSGHNNAIVNYINQIIVERKSNEEN